MRRLRADDVLPTSHLAVLSRLDRTGAQTTSGLAAAEQMRPQSMAHTVGELEKEDLVARRPDPDDGRQILVDLDETRPRAPATRAGAGARTGSHRRSPTASPPPSRRRSRRRSSCSSASPQLFIGTEPDSPQANQIHEFHGLSRVPPGCRRRSHRGRRGSAPTPCGCRRSPARRGSASPPRRARGTPRPLRDRRRARCG